MSWWICSLLPLVYDFHSLFVLLECVLMLMTSTKETYLSKKGYGYHKIRKAIFNSTTNTQYNIGFKIFCFVCLFVLMLYVPSQQLWSLRDGQFT